MKQVVCGVFGGAAGCDFAVDAESPEAAMEALKPHWMEQHQDLMVGKTEEDMKAWYTAFHNTWAETPES